MNKYILLLVVLSILTVTTQAKPSEEIIAEFNTPENIQLISKTMDNRALIGEFIGGDIQNILVNNKIINFEVLGKNYYLKKYDGLYTECNDCGYVPGIRISEIGLNFAYNAKEDIIRVMREQKVDFWTKLKLVFKAVTG
jgi:hypothetical protein